MRGCDGAVVRLLVEVELPMKIQPWLPFLLAAVLLPLLPWEGAEPPPAVAELAAVVVPGTAGSASGSLAAAVRAASVVGDVGRRYAIRFRQVTTLQQGTSATFHTVWRGHGELVWWSLPVVEAGSSALLVLELHEHAVEFQGRLVADAAAGLGAQLRQPFVVVFGPDREVTGLQCAEGVGPEARNALRALVLNLGMRRGVGDWTVEEPDVGSAVRVRGFGQRTADGGFVVTRQKLEALAVGALRGVQVTESFGTTTSTAAGALVECHYQERCRGRELAPEVSVATELELHVEATGAEPGPRAELPRELALHPAAGWHEVDVAGREAIAAAERAAALAVPTAAHLAAIAGLLQQGRRRSDDMVRQFLHLARRLALVPETLPEVLRHLDQVDPEGAEADVLLGALGAAGTVASRTALVERLLDSRRAEALRASAARSLQQRGGGCELEQPLLVLLAEPGLGRDLHSASLLLLGTAVASASGPVAERLWQRLLAERDRAAAAGLQRAWLDAVTNSHHPDAEQARRIVLQGGVAAPARRS